MFYKIGTKIERSLNSFFKWVLESILNGWKGWVFVISGILGLMFLIIDSLKSNFWENTESII